MDKLEKKRVMEIFASDDSTDWMKLAWEAAKNGQEFTADWMKRAWEAAKNGQEFTT